MGGEGPVAAVQSEPKVRSSGRLVPMNASHEARNGSQMPAHATLHAEGTPLVHAAAVAQQAVLSESDIAVSCAAH